MPLQTQHRPFPPLLPHPARTSFNQETAETHTALLEQDCCLEGGGAEEEGQHDGHTIVWCSFNRSAQMCLLFREKARTVQGIQQGCGNVMNRVGNPLGRSHMTQRGCLVPSNVDTCALMRSHQTQLGLERKASRKPLPKPEGREILLVTAEQPEPEWVYKLQASLSTVFTKWEDGVDARTPSPTAWTTRGRCKVNVHRLGLKGTFTLTPSMLEPLESLPQLNSDSHSFCGSATVRRPILFPINIMETEAEHLVSGTLFSLRLKLDASWNIFPQAFCTVNRAGERKLSLQMF